MRRDEGVPPYRRLRRESYAMPFRAIVEKSPTEETKALVHERYKPAFRYLSHRRYASPPSSEGDKIHTRASPLARRGSLPSRPTDGFAANRTHCHSGAIVEKSPAEETKPSGHEYPK